MTEFETLEDFLRNDRFRAWIRSPDDENDAYWKKWLDNNPSKRALFENAAVMMAALEGNTGRLSDDYISGKVIQIQKSFETAGPLPTVRRPWAAPLLKWAAAAVFAIGIGWLALKRPPLPDPATGSTGITSIETPSAVVNTGSGPLLVNLPDGSSVMLYAGSKLEYTASGRASSRSVYLDGEGFFEVTRNPASPFLVHTKHFTTRVLGTSFLIRAFDDEPESLVSVRTGKVDVISKNTGRHPAEAILLQPNEELSLNNLTEEITRRSAGPGKGQSFPLLRQSEYEFHLTPVSEVFALLEKVYGVSIQYDIYKLRHCTLTATLSDEPFLDKIRMVCLSIEADFEVVNDQVLVTGNGCTF